VWHLLERHEMKRLSRGRAAARRGPRPRSALPAGTDLLPQIRHIVVLMMENHSYDNYLGMLPGRGEGFPMDPGGQPEAFNRGADGEIIRAFRLPSPRRSCGRSSPVWSRAKRTWTGDRTGMTGTDSGFPP
jgi:phospholipase C